jgi:membrane protease YdiL (CAAX protease family)
MVDPARVPDHSLDELIEPELRAEIGDPLPVPFAAGVVYWPLLAAGVAGSWLWTGSLFGPGYTPLRILVDAAGGAALAAVITFSTLGLSRRLRALRELESEFRRVLGRLRVGQILFLAVLSGASEEFVFRGVLQVLLADARFLGLGDTAAVWLGAIVFGGLHFLPHKVFWPWTLFAVFVGLLTGALFAWRESLVAPIALHITLNALNLRLITAHARPPGEAR